MENRCGRDNDRKEETEMVQSIVFDIAGVIAQWDPKGWSIRQFGSPAPA